MIRSARNSIFLLFLLVPSVFIAASDDQQRAHKILSKVTAMATDPAGKRAVSLAFSQHLSVDRKELALRRHQMNLNYGDLFVAYQLMKNGTNLDDIAGRLRIGKTVWQAADEQHADWKQIANEAKKLSGKVDTNLLKHFANKKSEAEQDHADGYNPLLDTVKADGNVSLQEIEDAQQRYIFLRDHAGVVSDSGLDPASEKAVKAVRTDPTRNDSRPGTGSISTPPH
jgi:hypothetical protein